jgi:hypothetical protein
LRLRAGEVLPGIGTVTCAPVKSPRGWGQVEAEIDGREREFDVAGIVTVQLPRPE